MSVRFSSDTWSSPDESNAMQSSSGVLNLSKHMDDNSPPAHSNHLSLEESYEDSYEESYEESPASSDEECATFEDALADLSSQRMSAHNMNNKSHHNLQAHANLELDLEAAESDAYPEHEPLQLLSFAAYVHTKWGLKSRTHITLTVTSPTGGAQGRTEEFLQWRPRSTGRTALGTYK